jgi:RimJ/RimL family protein N-acetyltransferase
MSTSPRAPVFETDRLSLHEFTTDDAAFFLALVNDPDWIRYIGDRNVHTLEAATSYLERVYIPHYASSGFGFYLVRQRSDLAPVGMCGIIRRAGLEDVDIGFAFMPAYRGLGYARESAEATLAFARDVQRLSRVVAIASPENARSIALLKRIGLVFEEEFMFNDHIVARYAIQFARPA